MERTSCRDCNLILITVDTLRPDHMGLYGYRRDTTPHLSRFFGLASVFKKAISPAPCTVPAVKQMLSGSLLAGGTRLAEVLKANRYQTAAVVSQQLFHAFAKSDQYARGFDRWDIQEPTEVDRYGMSQRTAAEVTARALHWLGKRDRSKKFFLWLHYFDPHDPYQPPEAFRFYGPGAATSARGDRRGLLQQAEKPAWLPWQRAGAIFSSEQTSQFLALYDGEIRYVDEQIGRLLRNLSDLDLLSSSVVVLTADHGERLGEDNTWDHCLSLHERELRVPLAVSVAGARLGRRDTDAPVSTLDVYPTVLDLLGLGYEPDGIDGRTLLKRWPGRVVCSIFSSEVMVRRGEWKLYAHNSRRGYLPTKLVDLAGRLDEETNLLRDRPRIRGELMRELANSLQQMQAVSESTSETVKQLKALGYI